MNATGQPAFRTSAWLYFGIAFAVAWTMWLLPALASHGVIKLSHTLQLACLFAGSFGPFFGALVATYRDGGGAAVREFFGRCLRYRIGPIYLLAAVFLVPVLAGIAMWLLAHHGGRPYAVQVTLAQLPQLYLLLFFAGGSVNEEFGWSYAIDRLRQGRHLLWATVLLGVIWGCWHIPLFFVTGLTQSFVPFWAFVMFTVALRLLIVWGYESNDRSILVALLFHTASNLSFNLYNVVDRSPQRDERGLIWWTLLMGLVAIVVALSARCYRNGFPQLSGTAHPDVAKTS
ncbi:MAG TPA: CPBP family intramembrane glutamic endopeptidase [Steroidobacteraceae bacterium]|nr:CPBP family intramembrane glutamic endopeptidase [Steroidobacteraceae bacterium]